MPRLQSVRIKIFKLNKEKIEIFSLKLHTTATKGKVSKFLKKLREKRQIFNFLKSWSGCIRERKVFDWLPHPQLAPRILKPFPIPETRSILSPPLFTSRIPAPSYPRSFLSPLVPIPARAVLMKMIAFICFEHYIAFIFNLLGESSRYPVQYFHVPYEPIPEDSSLQCKRKEEINNNRCHLAKISKVKNWLKKCCKFIQSQNVTLLSEYEWDSKWEQNQSKLTPQATVPFRIFQSTFWKTWNAIKNLRFWFWNTKWWKWLY